MRPQTKTIALLFVFIFIAGAAWVVASKPAFLSDATVLQNAIKEKQITIRHSVSVAVEVADTDASRTQGLSRRAGLPEGHGLLMVFPEDQKVGIWMKEMNFSIDVIWIDASGIITKVYPNMSPESYPQAFSSETPVRYVLEVPAGFTEIYNVSVGDSVQL